MSSLRDATLSPHGAFHRKRTLHLFHILTILLISGRCTFVQGTGIAPAGTNEQVSEEGDRVQPLSSLPPEPPVQTEKQKEKENPLSQMMAQARAMIAGPPESRDLGAGVVKIKALANKLQVELMENGQSPDTCPLVPQGFSEHHIAAESMLLEAASSQYRTLLATSSIFKPLVEATEFLAMLHSTGVLPHLVPLSQVTATHLYKIGVQARSLESHFALASRLQVGLAVEKNCLHAYELLASVANIYVTEVEAGAEYTPAWLPISLRNRFRDASYVSSYDQLHGTAQLDMEQELADWGHVEAQQVIAYRRLVGLGMDADVAGARLLMEEGAAGNDPLAQFNVGILQLQGIGGEVDYVGARANFERAAAANLPAAFNGLGVLYFHGQGVNQSYAHARDFWLKGYAKDDPESTFHLGALSFTGKAVPKNMTQGIVYLTKAHALSHWKAPIILGAIHAARSEYGEPPNGINCPLALDYMWMFIAERSSWPSLLQQAAQAYDGSGNTPGDAWSALLQYLGLSEQGCNPGTSNAAWILQASTPAGPVPPLAITLLEKLAAAGSAESLVDLATLTYRGLNPSVAGDLVTRRAHAAKLYQGAMDKGSIEATVGLAWMVANGEANETSGFSATQLYDAAVSRVGTDVAWVVPVYTAYTIHYITAGVRALVPGSVITHVFNALVGGGWSDLESKSNSDSASDSLDVLGLLSSPRSPSWQEPTWGEIFLERVLVAWGALTGWLKRIRVWGGRVSVAGVFGAMTRFEMIVLDGLKRLDSYIEWKFGAKPSPLVGCVCGFIVIQLIGSVIGYLGSFMVRHIAPTCERLWWYLLTRWQGGYDAVPAEPFVERIHETVEEGRDDVIQTECVDEDHSHPDQEQDDKETYQDRDSECVRRVDADLEGSAEPGTVQREEG